MIRIMIGVRVTILIWITLIRIRIRSVAWFHRRRGVSRLRAFRRTCFGNEDDVRRGARMLSRGTLSWRRCCNVIGEALECVCDASARRVTCNPSRSSHGVLRVGF